MLANQRRQNTGVITGITRQHTSPLLKLGLQFSAMGQSPSPFPSLGVPPSSEESRPPLVPIAVGAIAVVVVIGLFVFFGRKGASETPISATDPYAANLAISDVAMSTANNFAGQQVTYIEGKITNKGSKTVNNAVAQIVFHDSLGQIAQKESQRVMVITTREPYIDTAPLSSAPLKPGQTREFRLTFEHVSGDWNMQVPEVGIVKTGTV